CCRDLQVEVRCGDGQELLEPLLRHRQSPYLCKVDREVDDEPVLNVAILSTCRYLLEAGTYRGLHDRSRADGRPAKPELCSRCFRRAVAGRDVARVPSEAHACLGGIDGVRP